MTTLSEQLRGVKIRHTVRWGKPNYVSVQTVSPVRRRPRLPTCSNKVWPDAMWTRLMAKLASELWCFKGGGKGGNEMKEIVRLQPVTPRFTRCSKITGK